MLNCLTAADDHQFMKFPDLSNVVYLLEHAAKLASVVAILDMLMTDHYCQTHGLIHGQLQVQLCQT